MTTHAEADDESNSDDRPDWREWVARRRAVGITGGAKPAPFTDPEKMQEALKASYVNLQKTITGLSDNDLRPTVKLFGRDWTKRDAVMHVLQDQHEHLGQSIA